MIGPLWLLGVLVFGRLYLASVENLADQRTTPIKALTKALAWCLATACCVVGLLNHINAINL